MNISDLLSSSNGQRLSNGVTALNINTALNNAAQTKANDMVTRNYWSHTTPDGVQPWTLIGNAGYQYKTAGENLAYGFDNGSDTITGWMNSPAHRDNLLNGAFVDVGFGFANSADFVGNSEQTVIVAMYGAPLSQPTVAPAAIQPTPPQASAKPAVQPIATQPTPSSPVAAEPIQTTPTPIPTPVVESTQKPEEKIISIDPTITTAQPKSVKRIQVLTGGSAIWSNTLLVLSLGSMGILIVLQRGLQLRRALLNGEHFVLQHLHLDFTVVSLFILGATLLQTTGIVR
jgi:hypothetical protein